MAAAAVLTTTELLEDILLHLDLKDLAIVSNGVCKQWTEVVTGSPKLRQKLFLSAIEPTRFMGRRTPPQTCSSRPSRSQQFVFDKCHKRKGDKTIISLNPVVKSIAKTFIDNSGHRVSMPSRLLFAWDKEASPWRNMFITQPPVTRLSIEFDVDLNPPSDMKWWWFAPRRQSRRLRLERPGGVRIGDIVPCMQEFATGKQGAWEVIKKDFHSDHVPPFNLTSGDIDLYLEYVVLEEESELKMAKPLTAESAKEWA